ncbi:MAG: STAS domain-containing protein [Candidatus Faecousia sp.]|nr:STAS domain-containing protein [Candidatus Faecousia sp.]
MNIEKKSSGTSLTVTVSGRLDTLTAPALEQELKTSLDGVTQLVLDFKDLEYISSAGLRVLLGAHKAMKGNLIVKNANQALMEVFDITGFADILTIE